MVKIVLYPNDILRKKTDRVTGVDVKIGKEVDGLVDYLFRSKDGVGLAAPQIGVSKSFLAIKDRQTKKITVYINPKIDKFYGKKSFFTIETDDGREDFLEGCLSFPKLFGSVKRWSKVSVSWQEIRRGKLVDKKAKLQGFEAIVMQHEIDHLSGVLFVDHVKEDKGKFYKMVDGKMVERDDSIDLILSM